MACTRTMVLQKLVALYGYFYATLSELAQPVHLVVWDVPLQLQRHTNYGWRRDLPDIRDVYHNSTDDLTPSAYDLTSKMPPVYDQGTLGSCTANAIAAALQYDELKQGLPSSTPSRLFIYYNERVIEGTVSSDSGAMIRDGIKAVNKVGYCNETLWPYDISKFSKRPSSSCFDAAKQHKALVYKRVSQKVEDLKYVLSSGYPVIFGITVYSSFESESVTKTGNVPLPSKHESVLGGHAILLVSYDDNTKRFGFRNSWGEKWGVDGYGRLPYEYVLNPDLADDFWTLEQVE